MSGGSMDYVYSKVRDARFIQHTLERKAFAKHLALVAQALHDIEWVDSGDYTEGDENAAIHACISKATLLTVAEEEVTRTASDLHRIKTYAAADLRRHYYEESPRREL